MDDNRIMPEQTEFVTKAASIGRNKVSAEELAAINRYSLKELKAEDVFTFSVILCDSLVDRAYEHFTEKALSDMAALYVGRTVIKDHRRTADNQIARIYETAVIDGDDGYKALRAKAYMVRTASNADLIREIEAGIKKEGSVSFMPEKYVCDICGRDNMKEMCRHWPGMSYVVGGAEKLCTFSLDGVKDAYEFSLVAVPAQPKAGACKCYKGGHKPEPEPEAVKEPEQNIGSTAEADEVTARYLNARIRAAKNQFLRRKRNDQENA